MRRNFVCPDTGDLCADGRCKRDYCAVVAVREFEQMRTVREVAAEVEKQEGVVDVLVDIGIYDASDKISAMRKIRGEVTRRKMQGRAR